MVHQNRNHRQLTHKNADWQLDLNGVESSQPDKVLDGDLDKFVEAELQL